MSIQAFGIFPKIREIDALLRERAELRQRVIKSHPEVAFWRLNGGHAMRLPKKVKGMVNPPGMAERRNLLRGLGLAGEFLERTPPHGAATDDFLDACALLFIAARHARGEARPFPDPPGRTATALPWRSGLDGPRRHANGQDNRAVSHCNIDCSRPLL